MSAGAPASESSQSSSGYEDGLGRRVLAFDRESGVMLERLILRPELCAFEKALNERLKMIAGLEDERFAKPRTIEHLVNGTLIVISEFMGGRRLSDFIEAASEHGIVAGLDAGLGLLLELLPAIARLHDAGLAHGALAAGRIMITPTGQILLLDALYAEPLEKLNLTRKRLWTELRLAFPPTAGLVRFDKSADLSAAVMIAASLIVGRPLRDEEYPEGIGPLRQEIGEIASIRGSKAFADGVDHFFAATLPLAGKKGMASADEAATDLRKLVRKELGINTCRTALIEFLQQVETADVERLATETSQKDARKKQEAERLGQAVAEAERHAKSRADAERAAKEKAEAERRARDEAERKAREEAERKAREKAERKAREAAEREAREAAEREAREAAEREAREQAEREAREEAEREARQEAERKAAREAAERKAREAAERKAREEAERKAREEAERKAREEAERKAREAAERKAREEAERKAREEAERKAREVAERKAREEAERKAREEAERKAREEAVRKAREEAERKAREEAEGKAREEAERKARIEAERKAREEAERKARAEAERKAREEAERKARAQAERKAREEAERKARAEAERKAREEAERRERERAAQVERERAERERLERDRVARERLIREEQERTERLEKERIAAEALAAEQAARDKESRAAAAPAAEKNGGWLVNPKHASTFEPYVDDAPPPQSAVPPAAPKPYPIYVAPGQPAGWTAEPSASAVPPPVEIIAGATSPNLASAATPLPTPAIKLKDVGPIKLRDASLSASDAPTRARNEPDTISAAESYTPGAISDRAEPVRIPWKLVAGGVGVVVVALAIYFVFAPSSAAPVVATVQKALPKPQPKESVTSTTSGEIGVRTDPAGLKVLLDGKPAGESPVTLKNVALGKHVVTLIGDGGTMKRTVRVEAGASVSVDVTVFSGFVKISAPFVIEISENGKVLGTSDDAVILGPGRHKLYLSNKDLEYTSTEEVEVQPGETTQLSLDPRGRASINAAPWAEVWIDGEKLGETPLADAAIRLGVREIVFKNPQFPDRKLVTTIKAKTPQTIAMDFNKDK